jgi:nitroreductase
MTPVELGPRFDDALAWANDLHREQLRKATAVPYVSHVLAVCSLVLEHGGDEDQAVAALLHDAVEDQGVTVDEVRGRFGDGVAAIVDACTDTDVHPKPPWRPRKEAWLARLASPDAMPEPALLVAAADKLHNARSMLRDLRQLGPSMWDRFTGGRDGSVWVAQEAARIIGERLPGPIADELAETVSDLASWPGNEVGLLEGLATTRAIRRFTTDPVPDHDLTAILFAATRAPSGSNRQPFRFVVLRDGPQAVAAKALLGESFRTAWASKRAHDRYDEGSGAADDSPKARTARAMDHFVDHFEEIPVVVLPCLVRYRSPTPSEGASIYPACENLLLAARALGYGGVMTGWHAFAEAELRALLGIPEGVAIAATIPIGRPAGRHGPVRRRPLADLVFDGAWDAAAPWAVDPPGTRHAGGPR